MSKVSVAVIGLNGSLGAPTVAAFENPIFKEKFAYPVLALTRDPAIKKSTETIKYVAADLTGNKDDLVKQLNGIDVIISLVNPTPDTLAGIEELVTSVKPKLYIPSQFACEIPTADTVLPTFGSIRTEHSQKIRKAGVQVVDIYTSFFAGYGFLYEIVGHVGIDVESKSVTYLGSPQTQFSFTHLDDIGRVIASVASKANEKLPEFIRVQSGKLTPEQVAKRYEESHILKLTVKDTIPKEEVLKQAQAIWDPSDFSKLFYWLNVVVSQGEDKGASFSTNDNELVNPNQSLWKWEQF